jgi:hypothetical protein
MEQTGKVLAIGLYADGVVVFTIPENAPKPTPETPFGMDGLSLLVTVGGFEGPGTIRFGLKGSRVFEHPVDLAPGSSANIVLNLKPFRIASFGVKDVLVEVAGTKHILHFEVRAKYIDAVDDLDQYLNFVPALALPPPAKRTSPKKVPTKSTTKKARSSAPSKSSRTA